MVRQPTGSGGVFPRVWLAFPSPLSGERSPAGGAGATERPVLGPLPESVVTGVSFHPAIVVNELCPIGETVTEDELITGHGSISFESVYLLNQASKPLQNRGDHAMHWEF